MTDQNISMDIFLPPAATMKDSESLVVLLKNLPEKIVQKPGLEKETAPLSGTQLTSKVRRQVVVCVASLERHPLEQGERGFLRC